jgi:hypothetical protein
MQCPGFDEDDYAFYALGSLPKPIESEIDGHLNAGCTTCTTEIRRARTIWNSVAMATRVSEPPASLRRKLLDAVSPAAIAPKWWQLWWVPALAGAAAVVLCGVVLTPLALQRLAPPTLTYAPVWSGPSIATSGQSQVVEVIRTVPGPPMANPVDARQAEALQLLNADLIRERDRATQLESRLAAAQTAARDADRKYLAALDRNPDRNTGTDDVRNQLVAMTVRSAELERQVAQYRVLLERERKRVDQNLQLASMLSDPGLRVIRLRGTEKGPAIEGHAVIAGGGQMVFYGAQFPALPANRTYQLWLVGSNGNAVSSAGTFSPDATSRAALQLNSPQLLAGVTALAITDEPAGGSLRPTGHKWMIGS